MFKCVQVCSSVFNLWIALSSRHRSGLPKPKSDPETEASVLEQGRADNQVFNLCCHEKKQAASILQAQVIHGLLPEYK